MTNFQCVLLAGGLLKDDAYHQELLSQAKTIICADSGANEVLRLGFKPDYVVGDLDSLHPQNLEMLKTAKLIRYPREKDYPDTYYALQKALQLGYQRIALLACLGKRFDHAYANVMLLTLPEVRNLDVRILEPDQEIFLVKKKMKIKGQKGATLSLLPLSEKVRGITTQGLYYQVENGTFTQGYPLGVSNVLIEDVFEISLESGLLLALHNKKKKSGNFRFLDPTGYFSGT